MSGHVSGIVTAILLIAFIGGVLWAWSSKRKREFEQAARLPLDEDSGLRAPGDRLRNDGEGQP